MKSNPTFKVVIVYENLFSAVRAKELSEKLSTRVMCERRSWKFDALSQPVDGSEAAAEAADADMVIVATRGCAELPEAVKEWIESWSMTRQGGPAALVALFDEEASVFGGPPPSEVYLDRIAERARMSFFCNLGHLWRQPEAGRRHQGAPGLMDYSRRPGLFPDYSEASGWGIND